METEVMMPSPAVDFNFDSACTSPYISSPSSPHNYGNFFFSAPTSPACSATFFRDFDILRGNTATAYGGSPVAVPFNWEEKPGIRKMNEKNDGDNDFEFNFSGQLDRNSLSADELFDGGKIKPLKPPPLFQSNYNEINHSPTWSRSPTSTRNVREMLSPRHKKRDLDPFEAAIEQSRRHSNPVNQRNEKKQELERGREKNQNSSSSSFRKKGSRSVSPFRVADIFFETEVNQQSPIPPKSMKSKYSSSSFSFSKWNLKDLLLFRSASEGRAASKDPLRKYSLLKKSSEDLRNASFRSTESGVSVRSERPKRTPVASAHELHYTANRAVAEEMRRKTSLPYKHGLLGCLGLNPAVDEISRRHSMARE